MLPHLTTPLATILPAAMLLAPPALAQACPPDLAEPFGVLDGADQMELIARVNTADPAGDWDGSGVTDFFDVLAYLRDYDRALSDVPPPVESTFDADREFWFLVDFEGAITGVPTVVADYIPSWGPEAGNPGGGIFGLDPSGLAFYFSAPEAFLDDKSAFFRGTFSWDQKQSEFQSFAFEALIMTDGQTALYYVDSGPTVGEFRHYSVPLVGESFQIGSRNGPVASDAIVAEVLSDLSGIYILGDWTSSDDSSFLDNVRFEAADCSLPPEINLRTDANGNWASCWDSQDDSCTDGREPMPSSSDLTNSSYSVTAVLIEVLEPTTITRVAAVGSTLDDDYSTFGSPTVNIWSSEQAFAASRFTGDVHSDTAVLTSPSPPTFGGVSALGMQNRYVSFSFPEFEIQPGTYWLAITSEAAPLGINGWFMAHTTVDLGSDIVAADNDSPGTWRVFLTDFGWSPGTAAVDVFGIPQNN